MAFTAPTLTQAQATLASRLNDPGNVHVVVAELTAYLREALRTWNAWTQHWRAQGSFATVQGQTFYDLPTVLPALRGQTVTTWELVADLQYALLEPAAAGGTWTGTAQFTLAQLSEAIQRRRDQFLRDTGAILTPTVTTYASPPASGRIALDEGVLVVRRAAWKPTATELLMPLLRTDEWAANHFSPAWPQATDPPSAYSTSGVPPITLQLLPPTTLSGDLDLVSISKGAVVDPLVSASLGVSDDLAWGVKFGALADLLSNDALALDPARQAYCESRYQQAVQMAQRQAVVLAGRIDGVTCPLGSLAEADTYSPLWQLVSGAPQQLLLAGQNLLATWPRAGAGPYTILLDVVQNAPVPSAGGDILQVGQDIYEAILDYAQHLATFKDGVGSLQWGMSLLERATAAAGVSVDVQQASQPSRRALLRQTQQDTQATAKALAAVPVE